MTIDTETLVNGEANPTGATLATPPVNAQGETSAQPQLNEGKQFSQQDLDNIAAKARGTAERETKRKLLAQLGLTLEDENKLNAFKEAYQNSLTDEEKRTTELNNLQAEKQKLAQDLEEKDYVIKALIQMTGKKEEDVEKIVRMAKGLKNADNTVEDAIAEVLGMINTSTNTTPAITTVNTDIPVGQPITQPSSTVVVENTINPFKAGQINLTKQGELLRTNPELAKKLATEAGVKLPII